MTKKRNKQRAQAIAVFADCQNVSNLFKYRRSVLRFVEQLGQAPFLWAYDYWRGTSSLHERQLLADRWQCIDVATQKPNALDEQLIEDCRRLCGHPFIKVVVLIAGDKDYASLVQWLLSQNKRVIIIGRRDNVHRRLRALVPADVYIIEDLGNHLNQEMKAA